MSSSTSSGSGSAAESEIIDIVSSLIALLGRYDDERNAVAWLEDRRGQLKFGDEDTRLAVMSDLHRIVPGMGGLADKYLVDSSPAATEQANSELHALASRLYVMTDPTNSSSG